MITVKELKEQLEKLEKMGLADAKLFFRDYDDRDHLMTEGMYDYYESKDYKYVVLGYAQHRQEEDKEMAIYNVLVRFTGYVDMEIEADSEDEAREIAACDADAFEVDGWDVDIDDCTREDD